MKWPIVVDWTSGRATAGDFEGVKDILEYQERRGMEKLKRKRIVNQRAGSHDLPYVLRDNDKCPYQTRHGELTPVSDYTLLPIRFVGATGYLGGEWFLHLDVACRDYRRNL